MDLYRASPVNLESEDERRFHLIYNSFICSGTVKLAFFIIGDSEVVKKCKRGKGTKLTAYFLRSAFSKPGNLIDVV